jgi:hypothetical protein
LHAVLSVKNDAFGFALGRERFIAKRFSFPITMIASVGTRKIVILIAVNFLPFVQKHSLQAINSPAFHIAKAR